MSVIHAIFNFAPCNLTTVCFRYIIVPIKFYRRDGTSTHCPMTMATTAKVTHKEWIKDSVNVWVSILITMGHPESVRVRVFVLVTITSSWNSCWFQSGTTPHNSTTFSIKERSNWLANKTNANTKQFNGWFL